MTATHERHSANVSVDPTFRVGFRNGVEELTGLDIPWTGAPVPHWLHGAVLVRNGPGLFHLDDERMNHWFDGLALLTRFEFGFDTVHYRSAFLQSRDYVKTSQAGTAQFTEFGTSPQRSLRQRVRVMMRPSRLFGDNASVNVIPVNGEWWALWDVPKSMRLDGASLETLGPGGERPDARIMLRTPHPIRDGDEWVNVGVGITPKGPGYTVFTSTEPEMAMRHVVSVRSWTPAYLHSFALSKRHVVITEHPFGPTPAGGLALLAGSRPLVDGCQWRKHRGTRMLVIDRHRREHVASVDIDDVVVLHHVNAFEDKRGVLHVDACTFRDRDVLNRLFFRRLESPGGGALARATLQRYRIDTTRGTARIEALTERPVELPSFDPRRTGLPYRYVYGVSMHRDDDFNDTVVKVDLHDGSTKEYFVAGSYPSEPIFVPNPHGTDEDDGVVLVVMLDSDKNCSFVVALDAADLSEIGRAQLPHVVPHGLHGSVLLADRTAL